MDEEAFSRSQTTISVGERGAKSQRRGRFVSEAVMAASALLMLLLLLIVAALTWALVRAMPADTEVKPLSKWTAVKPNQTEATANQTSKENAYPGIPLNQINNTWFQQARDHLHSNLQLGPRRHTAKNAILFIGDGMGPSTVTAARLRHGQLRNASGEEGLLSWERLPWSALVKTYNLDAQVGDSAATAGALVTGVLTNQGVVGVDGDVERGRCAPLRGHNKPQSILALAERAGMATGLVTTTRVTHATPAVLYAHAPDRHWESDADVTSCEDIPDIARQLVEFGPGDGLDVVLGGGRREFMPYTSRDPEHKWKRGRRRDGRDLVREWLARYAHAPGHAHFVWNYTAFQNIDVSEARHVMGLFESSHMNYEADRLDDRGGEPSLEEMTEKALQVLQKNPKGFFLMVEGGRIDHAHHSNNAFRALGDTLALERAVHKALTMTSQDDTLVIVTADHSHVFTIAGNPSRGNPILGLVRRDGHLTTATDGKPYTTLGYTNGPSANWRGARRDPSWYDTEDKDFHQAAAVNLNSETHGGEDVGVYAAGPGAHLVRGVLEQTYVFHVMDHALCLSESARATCEHHAPRDNKPREGKYPNTPTD